MTLATTLSVGEVVPVALILEDGNTSQYPQAVVYDATGTPLTTLDLTHVANGLYTASYVMPNTDAIELVYITYSDAAHTTENTTYGRDVDVFNKGALSLGTIVEGTTTFQDTLRLVSAVLFGKSSGGGTSNAVFRDLADTKDRVVATTTTAGNRTGTTLDASD